MQPKRSEAELDALVEMTRNEAKPAPVRLSPEMLGEEDLDYFAFIYDMAKAFHRNQSFLYAPKYGDDALKWAEEFRERLLNNHGEG